MKFISKRLDLNMDLTTISGEQVLLKPKGPVDGKYSIELLKKMRDVEQNSKGLPSAEVYARELSLIYDKQVSWFIDNINSRTLTEMLKYCVGELNGSAKN